MRFVLLVAVLVPSLVEAQPRASTEALPPLDRMEQVRVSEAQQVMISRDASLRAMLQVQNGYANARRGYALYGTDDDCASPDVICAVVSGPIPVLSLTIPFATEGGLGTTRVQAYSQVDGVRLGDRQAEAIARDRSLERALRVGDDGTYWARDGYSIVATDATADDCSHPRVQCGVVFEVETTLQIIMIGE